MDYLYLKSINCKQGAVRKVRFNVDGLYCITCGSDKTIKLWNPHKEIFLKSYAGHGNEVLDACSSCDSRLLIEEPSDKEIQATDWLMLSQILSGGLDKIVILWDVSTGKPVRRLRAHASNITCVKFNEEGSVALSGSHDNTVMCWDVRAHNFQPFQTLKDSKDSVTTLQVTDHEIVTGSLDCRVRRYDIRAGALTVDYVGDPVTCVNLTRDSQCYLVSTSNSIVWLFDKGTGELLSEYSGHSTGDFCVENGIERSDSVVMSGSTDGRVYCWDLIQGTVVNQLEHPSFDGVFPRPAEVVHSLAVHPTDSFLMTATKTQVHLWGTKPMEVDD